MLRFGLHDSPVDQLASDDIARMAACRPTDIVSLHQHRDRWPALHQAMPNARLHARIDFRGPLDSPKGDAAEINRLAREFPWVYSWRVRNEPQLETLSATSNSWRLYLIDLLTEARRLCPPGTRLAIPAVSPTTNGAEWLRASIIGGSNGRTDLLDLHAYGTPAEIEAWVVFARSLYSGPILVSETNPGPGVGRRAEIERWSHDLADTAGRLDTYKLLGMVLFAWTWPAPDFPMDLAPEIKGTPVEAEVARLNRIVVPPGGTMTFIDQAELDFMHSWQNQRNANKQDPSSLSAYQAFLVSVGKDPTNPRHYGAMVADEPAPPAYLPTVQEFRAPAASIQGTFAAPPKGVILHGSRSGQPLTEAQEALATARYCQAGTGGNDLAWSASIGPNILYIHTEPNEWGWNAGADSKAMLAVEFAQPHQGDVIGDAQVNAFCWWFVTIARKRWPNLPLEFPYHSCLPQGISAGKDDLFACNSILGNAFKARILKRLRDQHGIT